MEVKARKCLTREENKKLILANYEEGKSYSEIAGIARRSKSVVYRVISRFKTDKILESKLRTSNNLMTTKREDRMIVEMSLKGRFDTATFISSAFDEQTGKSISRKIVSRTFLLVARITCHKPLISKKNQKHIPWTVEQWNMVHFSDESKFNLFVKNFFASIYAKGRLKFQYSCKTSPLATKLKLCHVFLKGKE